LSKIHRRLLSLIVLLSLLTACGASPNTSHVVTYRMTGTAYSASLTYQNASGGTEQKDARLPWEWSFAAVNGQFVYISGQNRGTAGAVTCAILLDGAIVKTSTSDGAYKIASCSGKL
jgi:hypothetical protein